MKPKVVLWWGIAVAVVGAALTILLPTIAYGLFGLSGYTDQTALVAVELVARVAQLTLPAAGAALIGASIVMAYMDRL